MEKLLVLLKDIHRRPTKFLKVSYQQKCLLELKGTDKIQNAKRLLNLQNSIDRKWVDRNIQLQNMCYFS